MSSAQTLAAESPEFDQAEVLEKVTSRKTPGAEADDEFLVTLQGREHLSPHTWGVGYRWFLTGFAGLLVLNASKQLSFLQPDRVG